MDLRVVAGAYDLDHGGWREGPDLRRSWHRASVAVSEWRPGQQLAAEHDPGLIALGDHRAIGQVSEPRLVQSLPAVLSDPFGVEHPVDVVHSERSAWMRLSPRLPEAQ